MYQILKFIYTHPFNASNKLGGLWRFLKWQLQSRIFAGPFIHAFTEQTKMLLRSGMTGATGNLYCGLHEYNDMAFVLHALRPMDLFVDVGANVGSYTLLAAGEVGANTICFEPVPSTFFTLKENLVLNKLEQKVAAHNMALGGKQGTLWFTSGLDTVNHVVPQADADTISVPVATLDQMLHSVPLLMKIDVEGYETEVLKGATTTLHHPGLKAIIIELNGSGHRYGFSDEAIHQQLTELGFLPYRYDPDNRQLTLLDTYSTHNTLYIRDIDQMKERVRTARKVRVQHRSI